MLTQPEERGAGPRYLLEDEPPVIKAVKYPSGLILARHLFIIR